MADRSLVLNDVLCFLLCKYGSVPLKMLKSTLMDFYDVDVIAEAKVCLLDSASSLNSEVKLPHVPQRRDGDSRLTREIDDILLLISHLDERKLLESLPRYVCSGPDNIPSLRIYEGDLKIMMNMISNLANKVAEMGSGVAAIAHDVRDLQARISAPEQFPTLRQAVAQAAVNSVSSRSQLCQQPPNQLPSGNSVVCENVQLDVASTAIGLQTDSENTISRSAASNWATKVSTPRNSSNRFAALATTTDDDETDNRPFEQVRRRSSKRLRSGTPEHLQQQRSQRQPQQRRQQSAAASTSAAARPDDTADGRRRRGPLLRGNSSTRGTVSAARTLTQKSVFYIDNVNVDCSADDMKAFVSDMNVEVISCFSVVPRKRQGSEPTRQAAFRLCINNEHCNRMLNAANWPTSVTVSEWYFKPPNSRVQRRDEDDQGSRPILSARVQQQQQQQQAARSSQLAAGVDELASTESEEVGDRAVSDDTVIVMEYSAVNVDTLSPTNGDGDD